MKKLTTRLKLLQESFYPQTLGKILQHEINIKIMEKRTSIAQPSSPDFTKAQAELPKLKKELEGLNMLISIILDLIVKEQNKNGKET